MKDHSELSQERPHREDILADLRIEVTEEVEDLALVRTITMGDQEVYQALRGDTIDQGQDLMDTE